MCMNLMHKNEFIHEVQGFERESKDKNWLKNVNHPLLLMPNFVICLYKLIIINYYYILHRIIVCGCNVKLYGNDS